MQAGRALSAFKHAEHQRFYEEDFQQILQNVQ